MLANYYNSQVIDLFLRSSRDCFFGRAPMFYDELEPSDLLFIGVNPSFSDLKKSYSFVLANCLNDKETTYLSKMTLNQFEDLYSNTNNLVANCKYLGDIHRVHKLNYAYFNKFKQISAILKVKIEHIDLFPMRETSQVKVAKCLNQNMKFREECCLLLVRVIAKIRPKVIIVENSYARDALINSEIAEVNDFFPPFHFDTFKSNNAGTPVNKEGMAVYYTSMLTGQRAMDLGSFHRLIWSINSFLKLANGKV